MTTARGALPLDGILVLDFSQFLAGPVAAMRLADLGARVIKIERPGSGDIGRTLAFAGRTADGDTVSFHAMNRNKESITADLKKPADLDYVKELVAKADVLIQNFRPGVMERIGLDYESVRELNPSIVYASATGYGSEGPWATRPGQDLLAQSVSGLPWLSGSAADGPVPVGLSIADHLLSCHIAQGATALLVRRFRTGEGGLVESSLLEAMLDLQFELLSVRLNDDSIAVKRHGEHSAHAFLAAPYGTYPTLDGYIALAMNPIPKLGELLELPELTGMVDPQQAWDEQERIEALLAERFATGSTEHWLGILDAADVWCAPVLTLDELLDSEGFAAIRMTQEVERRGTTLTTTRSPLRVDGQILSSRKAAPLLGEDDERVRAEFPDTGRATVAEASGTAAPAAGRAPAHEATA
ncbi:CaiB/BaiF CoA transferase family protein [Herbiconiux flava]|uniref:Crotonobetainyl-CoA:carnitine CoA-transferase CaiB-like acyl-CoA transferase n=1 Tax=Herbiconiux flava TaxID=881268 RepID=A0A852SNJ6_9MICO|nr:CaiB/BaiF CoA-transferase family protein [Herbiconiux flava]NYD70374.1 crotonobetainyl-CoA:carnitine CoA-transferase CaiB-like acyl-CoA transferase [Herbiconiux flava]GLK17130.1 CoA transferase [Herbiconiux flava]